MDSRDRFLLEISNDVTIGVFHERNCSTTTCSGNHSFILVALLLQRPDHEEWLMTEDHRDILRMVYYFTQNIERHENAGYIQYTLQLGQPPTNEADNCTGWQGMWSEYSEDCRFFRQAAPYFYPMGRQE